MAVGLLVWEPLLVGSGRGLAGSVVAGAYPVFDVVLFGFAGDPRRRAPTIAVHAAVASAAPARCSSPT